MTPARGARPGAFSLVEVVVALVILAVGLLGLAAAMGYISGRVRAADLMTERAVARQNAIERIRALPFDHIRDRPYSEAWTVGRYKLWWNAEKENVDLYLIEVVAEGPAHHAAEGTVRDARDTTVVSVVREVD